MDLSPCENVKLISVFSIRNLFLVFCVVFFGVVVVLFVFTLCHVPNVTQWRIQRGAEGDVRPPPPPLKKKREREREAGTVYRPSIIKHISIHSFACYKCNKSLYIFTRCIALLVYLITFELL